MTEDRSQDARTGAPVADWPDEVDDILGGDLVVAVGMPTPKGGVVLASVTPIGLRDRTAGTVSFTTSLGFGRKLERIAADPRIAVLYHTRQHGHTDRPGVVLVQGVAAIVSELGEDEREQLRQQAATHMGQIVEGWFWDRWLSVYYWDRVVVEVRVARILWWPDGEIGREPTVLGEPLPDEAPASQTAKSDVTTPRVVMSKVARGLRKPHRVIGVLQADGIPLVLPVEVTATDDEGVRLRTSSPLLPPGERRAGVLSHDFRPQLVGLSTATHTGWLRAEGSEAVWTPHTRVAFAAPPNKTLLLLANGALARWGYRRAIKQGRHEILTHARR